MIHSPLTMIQSKIVNRKLLLLTPQPPGRMVVALSKNRLKTYSYRGSNAFLYEGKYSNRGSNTRFKRENLFEPLFPADSARGRLLGSFSAGKTKSTLLLSSSFIFSASIRVFRVLFTFHHSLFPMIHFPLTITHLSPFTLLIFLHSPFILPCYNLPPKGCLC